MNGDLRREYKNETKDNGALSDDDRKNRYIVWLEDELTKQRYVGEKNTPVGNRVLLGVSDSLTIKQVAAKYGEKVECVFFDYDNEWKKKTMIVNAAFIKDMEQGAVKDCR